MKLTQQQLDAFGRYNEDAFVRRTAAYLRERFSHLLAARGIAAERVDLFVRESLTRAAAYQVVNDADVRWFCECRLELGLSFDRDGGIAWAGEILNRPGLSGAQRMDLLAERLAWETRAP